MGYTREAIKGISWVGAFQASAAGISFVRTIILARILTPSEFGLVAIATLVLGFIEMLTETGVNIFLVQEEDATKYISTAWVVSIIRGFIIALIIFMGAFSITQFFHAPAVLPLLLFICLVPIVRGFINPSEIMFQKKLLFHREFWFRLTIFTIDATTAVIIALLTHSAISLIWGFLIGAIFEVLLSFILLTPRPRIEFDLAKISYVFNRGKWVTAFSVFNYAFQNADNIVVGRMLGASPLGLYQVSYKIATISNSAVDSISRVTFPVFTKIEGDKKRLLRAVIRTNGVITLSTIAFGLILFFFTKEIVGLFLGDRWFDAIPVLKALALFGILRSLVGSTSAIFLAVKKQEYVTVVTLISFVGLMVTIVPLISRFGIIGAALAASFGAFLTLPFIGYSLWRIFR